MGQCFWLLFVRSVLSAGLGVSFNLHVKPSAVPGCWSGCVLGWGYRVNRAISLAPCPGVGLVCVLFLWVEGIVSIAR